MKRGEIWTVAGGAAYAGKPRPAVIVQDDRFDANDSIVVQELLGHRDVRTTMTYLHVMIRGALGVKSPMDRR